MQDGKGTIYSQQLRLDKNNHEIWQGSRMDEKGAVMTITFLKDVIQYLELSILSKTTPWKGVRSYRPLGE